MAFDLVTWAPAIGGGGDNNYNVPGATKLDNTLDTSYQCGVDEGDSSGFSATPTIAQLNASSGFNQIIGAYNRRALTYNSAFGSALATVAYVAAGVKPVATDFINLLSSINTLRTQEGWTGGSLVWPNLTPATGKRITGDHLAYLRKALAISGTLKILGGGASQCKSWQYTRDDSPYGTHVDESLFARSNADVDFTGKRDTSQATRVRYVNAWSIPEWLTSGAATQQVFLQIGTDVHTLENYTPKIYSYNSDVTPPSLGTGYNGTFYNPSTLEGTFPMNTSLNSVSVGAANIYAVAGAHYCVLFVTSEEYAGSGLDPIGTGNGAYFKTAGANNIYLQLTF